MVQLRSLLLSTLIFAFPTFVAAADINVTNFDRPTSSGSKAVVVYGDFLFSDIGKFKSEADKIADGSLVFLSSPGGSVETGIEIGREIKRRHFKTAVTDLCASACALAWLAGEVKSFSKDAKVGFHVAYSNGVEKRESGVGNALVGLYVGELGYKDNVIKYITSAPPDGMQWISARDASLLGIEVLVLDLDDKSASDGTEASSVPAVAEPATASRPEVSDADLETAATQFVVSVINTNMMDSSMALSSVLKNYAPQVDYFGSQKSLSDVYIDKAAYFVRWPSRLVNVKPETVAAKCVDRTCTVSGIYEWAVLNLEKNKKKSGTAFFNYRVEMTENPKISAETGDVIKRK